MNYLQGIILAINQHDGVALIDVAVGDLVCSSMLISASETQYQIGAAARLCFKEFEVAIARNLQGIISLSNRIPCHVRELQRGKIMTRLVLEHNANRLTSLISSRSAERLNLNLGDCVEALVKANEMGLLVDEFSRLS